jgi:phenylpropionate dioxygenase-like ring-hydroxylating dioxygenase large terminal subunit
MDSASADMAEAEAASPQAPESPFAAGEVAGVLRPLGEATTLPGRAYTDEEVFAFERDYWFGRDWVCVGRARDAAAAGAWFVALVGGAEVVVVGGDDGTARAFYNVCRHRGMALLEGCGQHASRIQCPYHGWSYDLRGRLADAPGAQDARGFDARAHALRPVRLEDFGGFLFANRSASGPRLLGWLDDLPAQLEGVAVDELLSGRRVRYCVRANWKLLMENFAESYHFSAMHPQLERKTPSRLAESLLSRGPWQGGWMPLLPGVETASTDGKRHGRPLLRKAGAKPHGVFDYLLFPNLFLSLQPDYLLAYVLTPVSHTETQVTFDVLFDPAAGQPGQVDAPDVYDFWSVTNAQDFAMCERQQRGVASPAYRPGTYTAGEEGVHEFDKIVAERYADP